MSICNERVVSHWSNDRLTAEFPVGRRNGARCKELGKPPAYFSASAGVPNTLIVDSPNR